MKICTKIFYAFIICLAFIGCNAKEKNSSYKKTEIRKPRQFKLTESADSLQSNDFYLSSAVSYHFSGIGDENSMDETPYMNDEAMPVLDEIASFLKRNPKITVSIEYADEGTANFDSCVNCAFKETILRYLVGKGVDEERILVFENEDIIDPALGPYNSGFKMIIN